MPESTIAPSEACIVGWAHSPFGKLDDRKVVALPTAEGLVVPGLRDRLLARSIAFAPRSFVARASERMNRLKRGR